jgi:hypothetical protein
MRQPCADGDALPLEYLADADAEPGRLTEALAGWLLDLVEVDEKARSKGRSRNGQLQPTRASRKPQLLAGDSTLCDTHKGER